MAFGLESGFFLGGVRQQANIDRQAQLQEMQLGLATSQFQFQQKQEQKKMALDVIEEMSGILSEMKSNFGGSSEEFNRQFRGTIDQFTSQIDGTASLAGLNFSGSSVRARLDATPTALETAQTEAKGEIAAVDAKIGAAGGDTQKQAALGVERPKADIRPFLFPDGTRKPVDLTDPVAVRAAVDAGAVPVSLGVQATEISALTGFTPKSVGEIRERIDVFNADLARLEDTLQAFTETPQAGGIVGTAIETGLGLVEQIPLIGEDVASLFVDEEDRIKVKEARTKARITVSSMLTAITKEESRFTDKERELANEALATLDVTASPEQIKTALRTAIGIMEDSRNREVNKLLIASKADLSSASGRQQFFDILLKNGFSNEQALDTLADMTAQRGIKF